MKSISALGTYMVAFRGSDGRPAVLHAFCPHMGAHLGVGGVVVGDLLRCPFHGWAFDAQGEVRHVPYRRNCRDMPENSKLKAYEATLPRVLKQNGVSQRTWTGSGALGAHLHLV